MNIPSSNRERDRRGRKIDSFCSSQSTEVGYLCVRCRRGTTLSLIKGGTRSAACRFFSLRYNRQLNHFNLRGKGSWTERSKMRRAVGRSGGTDGPGCMGPTEESGGRVLLSKCRRLTAITIHASFYPATLQLPLCAKVSVRCLHEGGRQVETHNLRSNKYSGAHRRT